MEIIEAIRNRRSIRGFKPDPVPREVLEELLDMSRWAPSIQNMQVWEFVVLGGKVLDEVKARLEEQTKADWDGTRWVHACADVARPKEWPQLYLQRSLQMRDAVDCHQFPPGTENLDEKRHAYWLKGGRFHDAPNVILVCAERALGEVTIFDAGLVSQAIMLGALAYGLGTCVMARPVYWPGLLREMLGISESKILIAAIAIGYPDSEALINSYPRHREPLDTYTQWYGF